MQVEVITLPERLEALGSEWNALVQAMPRPCIFLSWEWVWTWWRHFGGRSRLLVVTARARDGRLVGVAPLHIVRRRLWRRSLEFLGYAGAGICADHLDFLAAGPDRSRIVARLLDALAAEPGWDTALLAGVSNDSPLLNLWPGWMGPASLVQPGESCCFVRLPDSGQALWQKLRREHPGTAANHRRYGQRWRRQGGGELQAAVSSDEVEAAMTELARLHGLARERHGQAGAFARRPYRRFHQELARSLHGKGQLYLARLPYRGRTAAMLYGFRLGDVLAYYQSGFDPAIPGAGKLLLGWVLEDAAERMKIGEFDFLRGDESYKRHWTDTARRNYNLWAWQPGWRGGFSRTGWRLKNWLRGRLV